jgi:hypothetical protein
MKEMVSMKVHDGILKLLEPREQRQFLEKQTKQIVDERFESERDWFHESVWIPFLNDLCEQFCALGRRAKLEPSGSCNTRWFPKFYMVMPDESLLRYWITIKQVYERYQLKRFLSIDKPNGKEHPVSPYKSELLRDLSGVTIEALRQDFIGEYRIKVLKRRNVEKHNERRTIFTSVD